MSWYTIINPFAYFANRPDQVEVITPVIPPVIPHSRIQVVRHVAPLPIVSGPRYNGCTHTPPCKSASIHVPPGIDEGNFIVVERYVGLKVTNRPHGCTITPIRKEVRINLRGEGVPKRMIIDGIVYKLKTSASSDYYDIYPKDVTLDTRYKNSIPI